MKLNLHLCVLDYLFLLKNNMDLSMVNNDFYLSGMAALIGDIDSKRF